MLFPLTDAPAVGYRVVEPPPRPTRNPLPPDRLDAIARALLVALPLSPLHREDLLGRGFTEDEVLGRGYRTLPLATRRDAVDRLAGLFPPEELLRFPGFFTKQGRYSPYLSLGGAEGLLVPVRDAGRRIVAFRIRPDRASGGGKYRWMSSSAHGGPSPGTPLHVARPLAASVAFDLGTVYVTEGEIKADLAANRLGAVVLSVPGVSIRAGVVDAIRALGAGRVVLAFDADKATKPQVLSAEIALARELRLAGFEVQAATWPIEAGKGIDDLLAAGGHPAIAPYPFPKETRPARERLEAVPTEWVEARLPAPPPLVSIEEARGLVRAEVECRLRAPRSDAAAGVLVVRGTPGVGKTTITLRALQDANLAGALDDRRVLVSMERLDLIEEVLAREEFAELRRVAAVRHGRTDDEASPGHCADMETATALARRRQGVMRSYCAAEGKARCPFAAGCAYLAHLRRAGKARVVFAATALLRTEASELADFDVIIVDEALDAALVDALRVTRDDVDLWNQTAGEGRGASGPVGEWDLAPLLRILAHTLAEVQATRATEGRRTPLRPVLERTAALLGVDPRAAVKAALTAPTDREGRLPCEVPRGEGEGGRGAAAIPLRALRQVAEVLDEELSRPEGADTRAWLLQGAGCGEERAAPAMEFRVPRRRLIEVLSRATTINLDATPNLPLLKLAFPNVEVLSVSVPERVEVTQLVDALYVSATVEKHVVELGEVLARHFEGASHPAVFCEKRFRPDLPHNDSARPVLSVARGSGGGNAAPSAASAKGCGAAAWGHFGGNSRGTNAFSDVDAMAIVGHFLPPIDEAEADVRALRFAPSPPAPGPEEVLVPYSGRTTDGRTMARWVRHHPDPDVAEVLDARRTAMIRQVIGRARPSLRPTGASPLRVLLAAGWPVPEVPVARLATRAELSHDPERRKPADGAISFAAASPPIPGATPPPLAELNARRHEAFVARVDRAVGTMDGKGVAVSAKAIARELDLTSGRSVTRIAQLLVRTGRIQSTGGTPQALKRTSLAPRGVPPLDGLGAARRLPLWIAAPGGRSGRWKGVGASERPFRTMVNNHIRGPPTPKPSHLQEVRGGMPRKETPAG